MDEILTVFENNHIDPPWSHVLVVSLDLLMIGAVIWCIREFVAAQRAARQAMRTEKSTLPLHEGARFVAGDVEFAEGAKTAIRVTITQEGTQHEYKNAYTHKWSEVDREIDAQPFYLRLPNGERVRVEPPNDVMLVDKLDQMEWFDVHRRRRRAELVGEERAVVEGILKRGDDPEMRGGQSYRKGASLGWVMLPTQKRGMRVSTESLARRHQLRASAFKATAGLVFLIGLGAMCCVVPYRARLWFGQNVVAIYLGKDTYYSSSGRRGLTPHYAVRVHSQDERGLFDTNRLDIDLVDYALLPVSPGKIWYRRVELLPSASTLGKNSSVAIWQMVAAAMLGGLAIYRIVTTHRYRRWYEGPVIEGGSGVLPVPPNIRFPAEEIVRVQPEPRKLVGPAVDRISADFTDEVPKQGE